MNEDEVLAKITRLLERGCTMLASHHDCGAPLFRCQGNIVCPVCSFQEEPLSAVEVPAIEAGGGEDERTPDHAREQPPQIQMKSPDSAMEEDQPVHFAAEDRSCRSMGRGQSDHSIQDDALLGSVKDNLRCVLLLRLRELTDSLRAEQDLDKLERLLDCLEASLRVLRSLQR